MYTSDQVVEWYRRARHKYVWDRDTFADYYRVIAQIVNLVIRDLSGESDPAKVGLQSPEIGLIPIVDEEESPEEPWAYALYIAGVKYCPAETWLNPPRRTILSEFKELYRMSVGSYDDSFMFSFFWNTEWGIRKLYQDRPDQVEQQIEWRRKAATLVKTFETLANKSLNRRRRIKRRVRYLVLQRDKSTCQVCGRRAPEVRIHVDHILPVSWDLDWSPSDDPADYQALCEDCNLGKGSMNWLFEE